MVSPMYMFVVVLACNLPRIQPCGILTHTEVAHHALHNFFGHSIHNISYHQLIKAHPDAFQAGAPYPDAFYYSKCFGGKYHNVSEATHWAPFINATVNYIRRRYPLPWGVEAQKLVVFMFGFVSHQTADILWHSLGGVDQGFLVTMAALNFHGVFDKAHTLGDVMDDVVGLSEWQLGYMHTVPEWYVPIKDLTEIYREYFGSEVVSYSVIRDCVVELYAGTLFDHLLLAELLPVYAPKSPFLFEHLDDFFVGGVFDMSAWTGNIWNRTIQMLEFGTEYCTIPKSTLYIECGKNISVPAVTRTVDPDRSNNKSVAYSLRQSSFRKMRKQDIILKKQWNGLLIKPTQTFLEKLHLKNMENSLNFKNNQQSLAVSYYVKNDYSKVGWSVISGDLNGDDIPDLVIAAPGYGSNGVQQHGCVFVVFGRENAPPMPGDLDKNSDIILSGLDSGAKFGTSLAILDFDLDGREDLVVGASSFGSEQLNYTGKVFVFFGPLLSGMEPSIEISCKFHYCNLGNNMATGDMDLDGNVDLLLSSPYIPNGPSLQTGMASVFLAKSRKGINHLDLVDDADWSVQGYQPFEWFGYKLASAAGYIFVGAPSHRHCVIKPSCPFSSKDVQSVGTVYAFKYPQKLPFAVLNGSNEFESFGASLAVDYTKGDKKLLLAVGSPGKTARGMLTDHLQAGAVGLYSMNITSEQMHAISSLTVKHSFAHFGTAMLFARVSSKRTLIVGAPLWNGFIDQVRENGERGKVFVFPEKNANEFVEKESFESEEVKARLGHDLAVMEHRTWNKSFVAASAILSSVASVHSGNVQLLKMA